MMNYQSPGNVDQLPAALLQAWNREIERNYELQDASLRSRFFTLDPTAIADGDNVSVAWFGDPAEPAFCFDEDVARNLSDWGVKGRHNLHNEYLEYNIVFATDAAGKSRPKRVEFTTELREYWTALAIEAPDFTRRLIEQVLGYAPNFQDLYGTDDPAAMSKQQRKIAFSRKVAGNGNDPELINAGVPPDPEGSVNREHALFMTHPINGLDDLIYIVLFGAKPYSRRGPIGREAATKEQIFRHYRVDHLACRHADPRAATAAHDQAYAGKIVAFADPLGVYIASFSSDDLRYQDEAVPDSWTAISRGRQRLVFGPSDSEAIFLDDIRVLEGAEQRPLTGGYDLAKRIEVGPNVRVARGGQVADAEFIELGDDTSPIPCAEAKVCQRIKKLKQQYDDEHRLVVLAPRFLDLVA